MYLGLEYFDFILEVVHVYLHLVLQLTQSSTFDNQTPNHLPWCDLGRPPPTFGSTSRIFSMALWRSRGWRCYA